MYNIHCLQFQKWTFKAESSLPFIDPPPGPYQPPQLIHPFSYKVDIRSLSLRATLTNKLTPFRIEKRLLVYTDLVYLTAIG
jgi:hypothetical protein